MESRRLSYSERHLIALWITAIISGLMAFYLMSQFPNVFSLGRAVGLSML